MLNRIVACGLVFLSLAAAGAAVPQTRPAPDILVLGDSQLSFGAGTAFVSALEGLRGQCGLARDATIGVIGVRSSSLQSWTSPGRAAKSAICDIDPKWKVNAGAYGVLSPGDNPYVQIGQGAAFQFCRDGRSPLQAVFDDGYYRPAVMIMFLMGNAARRWAASAEDAARDARAFMADLPPGQPCIFMTSAPTFGETSVMLRQEAQANIAAGFAKAGGRCSFVAGLTPETIRENRGNAANFRRHASGRVKDPLHPTEAAAHRFLSLRRAALCDALSTQLGRTTALGITRPRRD
jgi:hypothetical protein